MLQVLFRTSVDRFFTQKDNLDLTLTFKGIGAMSLDSQCYCSKIAPFDIPYTSVHGLFSMRPMCPRQRSSEKSP